MRFHVLIATCDRPRQLQNLLGDVRKIGPEVVSITIAVDGVTPVPHQVPLSCPGVELVFPSPTQLGKKGYLKVQLRLWEAALEKAQEGDLFLCLSDDMRLCDMFLERVLDQWERIPLNRRQCLNLLVDSSRLWGPCWGKPAAKKNDKGPTFTQWMDGNFICDMRFARYIASTLPQVRYDPRHASSGVWKTVCTQTLTTRTTIGIWLVARSLVVHTFGESKMHGDLRVREPLHAVDFVDGEAAHASLLTDESVIACFATMAGRERGLQRVVDSLARQVQNLYVYANDSSPTFKMGLNTRLFTPGTFPEGLGDAAKFCAFERIQGDGGDFYYFTCDDDFVYAENYVLHTLMGIERYRRKAVVGYHGAALNKDFKSYYQDRQKLHWADHVKKDTFVHVIGTGVMAFHSSTIQPKISGFKVKNMADVWFSKLCQDKKVPRVVLAHNRSILDNIPYRENIYNHAEKTDAQRTEILRETADWSLQVCK